MKIDIHTHILPEQWPDLRERFGDARFLRVKLDAPCARGIVSTIRSEGGAIEAWAAFSCEIESPATS